MTLYRNIGGSWHTVPTLSRNVGGAWRRVVGGWRNVGGTWRQFFSGVVTATTNPTFVSGHIATSGTVNSSSTTCTASNGSGSYSYAWAMKAGSDPMTIISPNSATTGFTTTLPNNSGHYGVAICTVTDTVTGQTATATCSVSLTSGTPP